MNGTSSGMGALVAAMGLAVLLTAAPAATAQESSTNREREAGLGFQGLGARVGFVDPEGASSTLELGLHVDAGQFVRGVHLQPLIEYWSLGQSIGPYDSDISDLSFGADVNVDFPLQDSRIVPYVGGGLGIHFISFDSTVPNVPDNSENKLGLNIQGGIRNDIMPNLSLFGEARYNFVSDRNQLKVLGGFTYRFVY
jgi:opacity protein-like surface antigen